MTVNSARLYVADSNSSLPTASEASVLEAQSCSDPTNLPFGQKNTAVTELAGCNGRRQKIIPAICADKSPLL